MTPDPISPTLKKLPRYVVTTLVLQEFGMLPWCMQTSEKTLDASWLLDVPPLEVYWDVLLVLRIKSMDNYNPYNGRLVKTSRK